MRNGTRYRYQISRWIERLQFSYEASSRTRPRSAHDSLCDDRHITSVGGRLRQMVDAFSLPASPHDTDARSDKQAHVVVASVERMKCKRHRPTLNKIIEI